MKKLFTFAVIVGIIMATMLTTACGTTRYSETSIECKLGFDDGRDYGVIKYNRIYGFNNFDSAVESREYHKTELGEIVSDVYRVKGNESMYWFKAVVAG